MTSFLGAAVHQDPTTFEVAISLRGWTLTGQEISTRASRRPASSSSSRAASWTTARRVSAASASPRPRASSWQRRRWPGTSRDCDCCSATSASPRKDQPTWERTTPPSSPCRLARPSSLARATSTRGSTSCANCMARSTSS
ncbi:hypothetical protein T484DRAFT_1978457 [Baffinella frigidus]|nr:hypothetical protein T484DRAFT_1978457 [Cryptophyta sp. CCMP2293]